MLNQKLRQLREACGYTQQNVADALNIDRSTYAYYEIGKTTPDINCILKLSAIFNTSISDMLESEASDGENQKFAANAFRNHSNYDPQKPSHSYELDKAEKQLLIYFRVLSPEEKDEFMAQIKCKYDKEKTKRKRKGSANP